MKTRSVLAALIVAGGVLAPSAFAQTYAGASYSYLQLDTSGEKVKLGALTGRLGYEFNPNVAIEGEGSVGVSDDEYADGSVPDEISLDYQIAAYVVGKLPLPYGATLFGRVGYHDTKLDEELQLSDGSGLAYGAGLEFDITDSIAARFDYTEYDGLSLSTNAIAIGARMKF